MMDISFCLRIIIFSNFIFLNFAFGEYFFGYISFVDFRPRFRDFSFNDRK